MAFAHLAMAVRDVEAASRFLEETLGWRPVERPGNAGRPVAWLEVAPGQEVHLIQVDDYAPSPFDREYGRHLAVRYPISKFESLKEGLRARGAEVIAADRPTPFARFFFRGPDGYVFEVVEEGAARG